MKEKVINRLVVLLNKEIDQKAEELYNTGQLWPEENFIVVFTEYQGKDIELYLYPDSRKDQIWVMNDGVAYSNVERCLEEQLPTYDMAMNNAIRRIAYEQRYS